MLEHNKKKIVIGTIFAVFWLLVCFYTLRTISQEIP